MFLEADRLFDGKALVLPKGTSFSEEDRLFGYGGQLSVVRGQLLVSLQRTTEPRTTDDLKKEMKGPLERVGRFMRVSVPGRRGLR
jgi:hypothetical protein